MPKTMKTKSRVPIQIEKPGNASPLLKLYFELSHLKNLFRQGWLTRGITTENCESVAEHSFGVAILALMIVDSNYPSLDPFKVLKMALIHDFGEVYTGDIIPEDQITHREKYKLEQDSVREIFTPLPNGSTYIDIWEEFETGLSPEAKFVRQIDKLEMAMQACVYDQQGASNMSEFFNSARSAIKDPALIAILDEIEIFKR